LNVSAKGNSACDERRDFRVLEGALEERRLIVEGALRLARPASETGEVTAAIEHGLFAPAKRLRPILTLLVTELLRGDPAIVLPAGCAIEMVHTASLLLDDLPSMDNALLRRGRPTCHTVYGEATTILAAFALLNRAYEILAQGWPQAPSVRLRAGMADELARAIGLNGMIAGQARDLMSTDKAVDFATLEFIHSRKTGALFIASAAIGASASGAGPAEKAAVSMYAKNLGLAFQIVDDLIDVVGENAEAGKDVRQDLKKTTFVSFSGVEGAELLARELARASQEALAPFGDRAQRLLDLADYVVARRR
jgi:geranylgeranyl diphosphate synthase, type II